MNAAEFNPMAWIKDAPCTGATDLFFGKYKERPQTRENREAKARAVCESCVAIEKCREFAHSNPVDGIWAGENEEDRLLSDPAVPLNPEPLRIIKRSEDPMVVAALEIRAKVENPQQKAS